MIRQQKKYKKSSYNKIDSYNYENYYILKCYNYISSNYYKKFKFLHIYFNAQSKKFLSSKKT